MWSIGHTFRATAASRDLDPSDPMLIPLHQAADEHDGPLRRIFASGKSPGTKPVVHSTRTAPARVTAGARFRAALACVRRRVTTRILTAAIAALTVMSTASPGFAQSVPEAVTRETIDRWMVELSNSDRWGAEDERGTLNLITPDATFRAAGLVRNGITVSLSHDYITERAEDATSPFEHEMLANRGNFASDRLGVAFHGFAHTHMDALCHNSHEGWLYNGFARDSVVLPEGCARLGITAAKDGIVTRGILVDVARLRGVEYLEPGTPIHIEDLEAWEAETGIRIGPGDVLLVRAGRWARRAAEGPWATGGLAAGLHASVAPW